MVPPVTVPARQLGSVLEPIVAQVYFAPECHSAYEKLGFDGSAAERAGVALPDGPAYFTSRGSLLGQVPGTVVAAAFGVFNPEVVVPCVELGWQRTDAKTICDARTDGAIAQLRRIIGDEPAGLERANELLARAVEPLRPEGRALFAGLSALGVPDDPLTALWRRGDMLREYRGDSHIAAWVSAGLDATEIGLLTELYWGLALRSYARTRAWTNEQFDAATERLESKGLIADDAFTVSGTRVARAHRGRDRRPGPSGDRRARRRRRRAGRHPRPVGRGDPRGQGLSRCRAPRPGGRRQGGCTMIITDDRLAAVTPAEFAADTGWDPKPQGLCRGEVCVPAPGSLRDDGTVDVGAAADRLGMPVVHDDEHGVTAVGPGSTTGRTLSTAAAPDPELIDRDGNPFRLSSLHGRKVLLVAWASY